MLSKIKERKKLSLITVCLALFNMLFYFSMRCIWTGIGKVVNNQSIPNVLMIVLFVVFCVSLVFFIIKKEKWPMYSCLILSGILFIGIIVIVVLGAFDYMFFILREFFDAILYALIIFVIALMFFEFPHNNFSKMTKTKLVFFGVIVVFSLYTVLGLGINYYTYKPVVYAVEDDYQIVFSSSMTSTAWVEINGKEYYDLYAGSEKSETLVHKVNVPMKELDNAKEYKVFIKAMLMRGPFGSFEGKTKEDKYAFRPVNTLDGFNYYAISDVHCRPNTGVKCASYEKENLDCFIMIGDIFSSLEEESDNQAANKLAYGVTKGEIPVVYARGNHETKGTVAEDLYKYVASKNQKFYFTFKLNDVFGIVLDMGEDHDDDWWEYYDTAHFEEYRKEQIDFLDEVISKKEYKDASYIMAVCHFPLTYVNQKEFLKDEKITITEKLNTIGIDVLLSGHEHEVFPILEGEYTPLENLKYVNKEYTSNTGKDFGYFTDAHFPTFIVSRREEVQTLDKNTSQMGFKIIGLNVQVDLINKKETFTYTNQLHQKVNIVCPFMDKNYGEEIVLNMKED